MDEFRTKAEGDCARFWAKDVGPQNDSWRCTQQSSLQVTVSTQLAFQRQPPGHNRPGQNQQQCACNSNIAVPTAKNNNRRIYLSFTASQKGPANIDPQCWFFDPAQTLRRNRGIMTVYLPIVFRLRLRVSKLFESHFGITYQRLFQSEPCPDQWPQIRSSSVPEAKLKMRNDNVPSTPQKDRTVRSHNKSDQWSMISIFLDTASVKTTT